MPTGQNKWRFYRRSVFIFSAYKRTYPSVYTGVLEERLQAEKYIYGKSVWAEKCVIAHKPALTLNVF